MKLLNLIFLLVFIALVSAFMFFTIGIYSLGWKGTTVQFVTRIIPYPAARVGTHWIRLSDYFENVRSQKQFYETQDFSAYNREIDFSTDEGKLQLLELQRVVLWRMIEQEFVSIQLDSRGVVVTNADIQQQFEKGLLEVGNRDTISSNIRKFYGWNLVDFRDRFVTPQIQRDYLENSLRDDPEIWKEAKKQAEDVSALIKRGEDFALLAKQYSDDAITADKGGDLGVLTRQSEQLAGGQFDTVIFDELKEGEVSGILKSSLGYHIVKVTERVSENEVRVSHILIYPVPFQSWLERENLETHVRVLLHDFRWDPDDFELIFTNPEYDNIRDQFYPENPVSPFSSGK